MNNLFSAILLTISVIALNGCKESVDTNSSSHSYSHASNSTSASTNQTTSSNAPTTIISTPAGVSVVKVTTVTDSVTNQASQSNNTNVSTSTATSNSNSDGSSSTSTTTTSNTGAGSTNTNTATSTTGSVTTSITTTVSTGTNSTNTGTNTNNNSGTNAATTTNSGSNGTAPGISTSNCEASANPIDPFVRVQLHYGLLRGTPYVSGELGGLDSWTITEDAARNATVLKLDSTTGLKPNQLITYKGVNGYNRVAKIGGILANQINITSVDGLETEVTAGGKITNFYNDPTHPNTNGYRAMADFGFLTAFPITPNQTHVLLGDSWFDSSDRSGAAEFEKRLNERLPGSTVFNEGIGGNTLCDLIDRFESDVTPRNPQYVWINSSINDYFNDVSAADFKTRMQFLISKVQAIGAEAIVYDSAPAEGFSFGGDDLTRLSRRYASAVLDLFDESQQ